MDGGALAFVPRFPFLPATSYTVPVSGMVLRSRSGTAGGWAGVDPGGLDRPVRAGRCPATCSASTSLLGTDERGAAPPGTSGSSGMTAARSSSTSCCRSTPSSGTSRTSAPHGPSRPGPHQAGSGSPPRGRLPPGDGTDGSPRRRQRVPTLSDTARATAQRRCLAGGGAPPRRVRPERWRLEPPRAGARDALVVRFDRPLDHGLLARCLQVSGPARCASTARRRPGAASSHGSWCRRGPGQPVLTSSSSIRA